MKPVRIGLYGNFGAGNLGNECTLQAVIEQIRQRRPDAQFLCFCTDPADVRVRHQIAAFPSEAVDKRAPGSKGSSGAVARAIRILFQRIPRELMHWLRSARAVRENEMMIVAGTGIVADYMCGPLGWPYDIFRLSVLSALFRVKLVFLSVGVGPISHPLSRWFLKRSLGLAQYRSYRDEASRQYLQKIGFNATGDNVFPDVVFGLAQRNFINQTGNSSPRKVIGVGLKDYGSNEGLEPEGFQKYMDTMAQFIVWLQQRGYAVRLLIGDFQYDTKVVEEMVELLKSRNLPWQEPLLLVEPALSVKNLLLQLGETEAVVSARYHNLVMALIQGKAVMALSDHAKLDSVITDFGLAQYRVPLADLHVNDLLARFEQLESEFERLKPHVKAGIEKYRQELDIQFASLLAQLDTPVASVRAAG
jgi:polysaccharide pyruvyl transferase WcaK-like protein